MFNQRTEGSQTIKMNCSNKVNYCFTYPWNFNVIKHYISLNLKERRKIFRKKTIDFT